MLAPPVDRNAKLALATGVGLELRRRGMLTHVERLRVYYAAVRAGRAPVAGEWDDAMVLEWAKILRVAPYEGAYAVKPRMSKCGCDAPRTFTERVFPGGCKAACGACRETWLEMG